MSGFFHIDKYEADSWPQFVVALYKGTTLELIVSVSQSVYCGNLTNVTCNQLSSHTRVMKLSGLRLMGSSDMSMLLPIRRTILGPCLGHIRAMFWLFLQQLCFQMHEMAQIFTGESCKPNRRIPFSVKLFGPYKGHVWPILGPCFVYFYNMLASRCRKRLKFSPKFHTCHKENTL